MIISNIDFNLMYQAYGCQVKSDLINTNKSGLLICDKPYRTNTRKVQKGEDTKVLVNCAFSNAGYIA